MKNEFSIVFAEDDNDDYVILLEGLKNLPVKVNIHLVVNGEDLLVYLKGCRTKPNLLLIDLNMPRLDGFEALMQIKSEPRLEEIPAVIYSTSRFDGDIIRTKALGADGYIFKPFGIEELNKVSAEILFYLQKPDEAVHRFKNKG